MASSKRQLFCTLQSGLLLLTGSFMVLTLAAQTAQQTSPTNGQDGQTVQPLGKYAHCFKITFR